MSSSTGRCCWIMGSTPEPCLGRRSEARCTVDNPTACPAPRQGTPSMPEKLPGCTAARKQAMGHEYNVIDADGHILEPGELWEKYIQVYPDLSLPGLQRQETPKSPTLMPEFTIR